MGRPPIFKRPEDLLSEFKKYVAQAKKKEEPILLSGFCAYKTIYKEMFYEYSKKSPEFSQAVKKIRAICEQNIESGILTGKYNATAGIFNLKNNHGQTDRQEINNNVSFAKMPKIAKDDQNDLILDIGD